MVACPSLFSVLAVSSSNDEFRLIRAEVRNGLTRRLPYLIANSLVQIPYMLALALFALALPWWIGLYPWDNFLSAVSLMAAMLWAFESIAQLFGTCFRNALLGMLAMVGLFT